jgi:anti-sigma factor RsiW
MHNRCREITGQMNFYLDDELELSERTAIEAHLACCRFCGEAFRRERTFRQNIRDCRPLYVASPQLHAKIEEMLSRVPAPDLASTYFRDRVKRCLKRSRLLTKNRVALWTFIPAALVILWVLPVSFPEVILLKTITGQPSEFARMAVDNHQRHMRGQLPLEIRSPSAQEISRWFMGKVRFRVELPNYEQESGREHTYHVEGARLVAYNNDYAAFIAYKMNSQQLISLVATSDTVAQPSGGEKIFSEGITFHYDSIEQLKVITWSHRGLTYALVSDLKTRGEQSCMVCHREADSRRRSS